MTILNNETVIQILQQYDLENHVQPSLRPGHLRIVNTNNDVTCALEKMGGTEKTCELLGVTQNQIEIWIDEHYLPESFARILEKHTGYSISSLQEPTFYVNEGDKYWPHAPSKKELTQPQGLTILKKRMIAA